MNQNLKIYLLIIIFTMVAGFLRIYKLAENPPSLNVDEVSVGYNAFSILKTQRDEYGYLFPLSFKSLGDYKPPVYIYLVAPSIAFFGLNEFAIRLPNALISTLTIPLCYFFILLLTRVKIYALLGAVFLAISPWHIYHSRFALETPLSLALVMGGMICALKSLKSHWSWAVGAAISLSLAMYTYQTERLFVPLILGAFILIYWNQFDKQKKIKLAAFIFTFLAISAPFLISIISGSGQTRAQMMFISKDVEFSRYVFVDSVKYSHLLSFIPDGLLYGGLLFNYWLQKFLSFFNTAFLFYSGLGMTTNKAFGLGILYLFNLPLLILGIVFLMTKKITNQKIIISWILIGLIPASLTLGELNSRRILIISPMVMLILAVGTVYLIRLINEHLSKIVSTITFVIFGLIVVWNLSYASLIFSIHFPLQKGEGFMEGTKEAVKYVIKHQNKYKEVVFDPVLGTEGPFLVNVPHLYLLFYSQYDPFVYQKETNVLAVKSKKDSITGTNGFSFNKYTVRPINWRPKADRDNPGVLFVGSRWSLPAEDLIGETVLQKIYLANGREAYVIVEAKDRNE